MLSAMLAILEDRAAPPDSASGAPPVLHSQVPPVSLRPMTDSSGLNVDPPADAAVTEVWLPWRWVEEDLMEENVALSRVVRSQQTKAMWHLNLNIERDKRREYALLLEQWVNRDQDVSWKRRQTVLYAMMWEEAERRLLWNFAMRRRGWGHDPWEWVQVWRATFFQWNFYEEVNQFLQVVHPCYDPNGASTIIPTAAPECENQ
jgi:hypothetical protein